MLKAFFDEAGSSGDHKGAFILSGYVAPESEWAKFSVKWEALLKRPCKYPVPTENVDHVCRPLEYLHAVEMEGMGKKRFRRIGQQNRDYLIESSVTTIINSGIIGIGYVMDLGVYAELDEKTKQVIGDPYELCFQSVIIETAGQSAMFLGENTKERIAFIFERNPVWEIALHGMYQKMLAKNLGRRYRMGPLTFAEKQEFKSLQAADRLCYETYRHYGEGENRPQLDRLLSWPQHHGRAFNAEGMRVFIDELKRDGKL